MSTITAIGTSLGTSGINIIRLSGENSLNIIKNLFNNYSKLSPNSIIYGKLIDNGSFVDNVLISYFKAPNSFTGEDICEINCHGGSYITKEILNLVVRNGAEIATPGEFSKRAFLNGKMDLSEAEGIIDLINAKTKTEARIAIEQLDGQLFKKIVSLREKLIEILAQVEVSIDYPEYDNVEVDNIHVLNLLELEIFEITKLLDSYEEGKYIKNGINVAILGRPNVGKSSLLNNLAKYERVIVTDIAGTTRDIVEETVNIGDIILNISDTAGIRDTEDIIEKIGVSKSIKKIDEVDLVIYILNADDNLSKEDIDMISKIKNKGIKYIVVINKMDKYIKSIFDTFTLKLSENNINDTINISVYENKGIDELKRKIISMFFDDNLNSVNEVMIVNERHKKLLEKSIEYLKNAKKDVINDMPVDIISIQIKESAKKLGEIIGNDVSQDIVDKIFTKFCLGK
ncbi:MAG: tRNA uridine-5-carboxymethylaminomethyl(34) synthesis GTPase MnmE [Clostridia bacterium]|nr:tRNA uridine-5-carboxymethylaminomethyl(34) synthesis GTPase MnmE [Clostridia bacterium]MDD4386329.1 tRNA uridine-5-carboxymethylaminomethyl(34) synthesis GTPase MnmE [Clostridia bacterium]